jgi:GH25 family lysozyme M1 (1,4-beta-N-acetylmuramidase)
MQILLDVWEGALDVDETILHEADIAGLIIRLNDMSGGHHMDANFTNQWDQASNFLRAPYFVYNPWVNGSQNFNWLHDHLPQGVTIVFADIEVRKDGYSPKVYADEVQIFYNLISAQYKTVIYTGAWFLTVVDYWPHAEYWWARYPYSLCPQGGRVFWSWGDFKQKANVYGYSPDPYKVCPGPAMLWQCSGDKVILPGTANRPIDINLWNGTLAELEAWWGNQLPNPPKTQLEILWREAALHGWNMV